MFKRFVLGTAGIAAAVGGPAALFNANSRFQGGNPVIMQKAVPSDGMVTASYGGAAPADLSQPALTAIPAVPPQAPLGNEPLRTPSVSIVEAFNMNVTPEWIASRWPRVANGLGQINLQGYRVPLVTGSTTFDVAGSLTYYFNPLQQVQRITFQGTSGDPRSFIGILAQRFHLFRRLTNDPGLVVYETTHTSNDQPLSWLHIRPAAVLQASDPYHRFTLELVLEKLAE